MKRLSFKIPIYTWNFQLIILENSDDAEEVRKIANKYKFPDTEDLIKHVKDLSHDGGKTYTKRSSRDLIVIIFPHISEAGLIGTINHEKRHVIDDILEWHDVHDKEAAAYLDGWVSEQLYKQLKSIKAL